MTGRSPRGPLQGHWAGAVVEAFELAARADRRARERDGGKGEARPRRPSLSHGWPGRVLRQAVTGPRLGGAVLTAVIVAVLLV